MICHRAGAALGLATIALVSTACSSSSDGSYESDGANTGSIPSDDPAQYDVDTSLDYVVRASEPRWIVPSEAVPTKITPFVSNANVDIHFHENRLYMGWRSAPRHFAGTGTLLFIMSSDDLGVTWQYEHEIHLGADMREPRFLSFNGKLQFMFFEAGKIPTTFDPQKIWRTYRNDDGSWTDHKVLIDAPEVPWDLKFRNGKAWLSSYAGNHYLGGESTIEVYFRSSEDGDNWTLVDDKPYVYKGGVSETAFEFDADGSLWIITRNEDGDASGWGSHLCWAPADALADWQCPANSDPLRYDSPEMFRHGDDIYIVGRRDVGGTFGEGENAGSLIDYSSRPKRTALYQVDKQARKVVHLFDLPGAGDTSFPSVRRTGAHTFLLANYTSPLDDPDISWFAGQTSDRGTQIYLLTLTFEPVAR